MHTWSSLEAAHPSVGVLRIFQFVLMFVGYVPLGLIYLVYSVGVGVYYINNSGSVI